MAADGTWTIGRVRATRFLADGTDCTDPGILGACEVSASILDATGTPDDGFGVSLRGPQADFLTFRPGKCAARSTGNRYLEGVHLLDTLHPHIAPASRNDR